MGKDALVVLYVLVGLMLWVPMAWIILNELHSPKLGRASTFGDKMFASVLGAFFAFFWPICVPVYLVYLALERMER